MTLGLDAEAVEQGEPGVTQRGVFRHDAVVVELDARAAAREERGAVVEVVLRADVAALSERDVVEESGAVASSVALRLSVSPASNSL